MSRITALIKKYWVWALLLIIVFGGIRSWIKDQIQANRITELENQLLIEHHEVIQQEIQENVIEQLKENPEITTRIIGGLTE